LSLTLHGKAMLRATKNRELPRFRHLPLSMAQWY
jgi:hypothetical protein